MISENPALEFPVSRPVGIHFSIISESQTFEFLVARPFGLELFSHFEDFGGTHFPISGHSAALPRFVYICALPLILKNLTFEFSVTRRFGLALGS